LLGQGPRLTKKKKKLPGRGLTEVEKHWCRGPIQEVVKELSIGVIQFFGILSVA